MDGVGTMLGASGGCPEVVFNGKTWKIGHPTQRAKDTLERLAVSKATQEIMALRGVVDAPAYAELFEAHKRDITAGSFRTWGEGWQRITFSPQNAHLFLLSLVRECHPEATERDAQALAIGAPEELQLALAQVVPGFFTVLLADMPLPPEKRQQVQVAMSQVMSKFKPGAQ
jgi:hypothetical protein